MRNSALPLISAVLFLFFSAACGDDDGNGTNNNNEMDAAIEFDGNVDVDAAVDVDAGEESDGGEDIDAGEPDENQWVGSGCTCSGEGCEQMGVPVPNGGTISGCDDVPTDWTGAEKVCLRTYEGDVANNTYFANGYCSLMAVACEGTALICNNAVMGDYDNMLECPEGTIMVTDTVLVNVMGSEATIQNKNCVIPCEETGDCREDELDPVLDNAPTQYECMEKDSIKFCFDPRNLSEDYTATAF